MSNNKLAQRYIFPVTVVLITGLSFLAGSGCRIKRAPCKVEKKVAEPVIRVKLAGPVEKVVIGVDGKFTICDSAGREIQKGTRLKLAYVSFLQDYLQIGTFQLRADRFCEIFPLENGTLSLDRRYYRGSMRIYCLPDGKILAVNHVKIEDYLKGVLPGELPRRFRYETFKAQAIAARTFALYEKFTSPNRKKWDVTATESSQMYLGKSVETEKSVRAVRATCGIVLTAKTKKRGWKIFPTYYSSTCGGRTQPARYLSNIDPDIKPLRGNVKCGTCKISPYYRWSERKRTCREITKALNARYSKTDPFGRITEIKVLKRLRCGRIAKVEIIDDTGRRMKMSGERFRLTVGSRKMPSTWCRIRRSGSDFVFYDGYGLGHGVGMCQYGAEGMARKGYIALEILTHYYPDSKSVKAY